DRYLLRHETAEAGHYSRLHPANMSLENRLQCLANLKALGYQVGSGMMVGSPGQSADELVEDLAFLDSLKPAMIGIGPFIPASGTPFANEKAGSVETVLWLISLLRLRFPKALIPATTALATLCENGTEQGVLAGANVVMPNVTPRGYAKNYTIYDNKKFRDSESAQQLELLEKKLNAIDRFVDYGRGDYKIY
ncbi:MAG: [FeFe] hydrogenase H-cluster radical SAM maturase HydE, partial [Bacteroidaceae bacterium]|nr:[FeFe] hydrogenase H-cluster radical SAM maturase HydE [Bacteroidaceae bacterium]